MKYTTGPGTLGGTGDETNKRFGAVPTLRPSDGAANVAGDSPSPENDEDKKEEEEEEVEVEKALLAI